MFDFWEMVLLSWKYEDCKVVLITMKIYTFNMTYTEQLNFVTKQLRIAKTFSPWSWIEQKKVKTSLLFAVCIPLLWFYFTSCPWYATGSER